MDTVQGPTNET